ncbi:MAG: phosphotransferase [Chloroflexi bacterium]|nr:phosphotransferase [Chloroflexota bacterium]
MTSHNPPLPQAFSRTIASVYGDAGRAWLQRLPLLLEQLADRWSLTVGPPFLPLSFNHVAPALREDGSRGVLKLGVPSRELDWEIEALRWFDGRGAVQLLAAHPVEGALLLEHVLPGTDLSRMVPKDDDQATTIAAALMKRLWRRVPPGHTFPTVADWASALSRLRLRFHGGTGPIPAELVNRAEGLFGDLLASSTQQALLHGDLHHGNILAGQRETWLAIDPKGVVGDPGFEVYALLGNPRPLLLRLPDPRRLMERRASILADALGMDRRRLLDWAFAGQVLSACWSVEDDGPAWQESVARAVACAELLWTARASCP